MCRVLARKSWDLALAGRDEAELELLASDLTVRFGTACSVILCDLMAADFMASRLLDQAGQFDALIIASGDMEGDIAAIAISLTPLISITSHPRRSPRAAAQRMKKAAVSSSCLPSPAIAGDRAITPMAAPKRRSPRLPQACATAFTNVVYM